MFHRELEYILTIAEEGNITKAADKLHIAQPSLTQRVQRIECELGCRLFSRTNLGVKLTESGEYYCRMAKQTLQLYDGFLKEIGQLKQLNTGKLRIGASWYVSTTFLPTILSDYHKQYPNIEIDLQESRSSDLLDLLKCGKLDIAFVSQYPYEFNKPDNQFHYLDLCRDEFCVIASNKRCLLNHCRISDKNHIIEILIETLENQPFIMFRNNQRIRQITDIVLSRANIHPNIVMTTYGFPIAIEQVAADNGIAIMPRRYVETVKIQHNIQIFPIHSKYDAYWDIGACFYHLDMMAPSLQAFVQLLQKASAQF